MTYKNGLFQQVLRKKQMQCMLKSHAQLLKAPTAS